jgi:hypothetical protein
VPHTHNCGEPCAGEKGSVREGTSSRDVHSQRLQHHAHCVQHCTGVAGKWLCVLSACARECGCSCRHGQWRPHRHLQPAPGCCQQRHQWPAPAMACQLQPSALRCCFATCAQSIFLTRAGGRAANLFTCHRAYVHQLMVRFACSHTCVCQHVSTARGVLCLGMGLAASPARVAACNATERMIRACKQIVPPQKAALPMRAAAWVPQSATAVAENITPVNK